ncbi:hypothetical protein GUJ93_ZPchr0013g34091 [Zizania palustris]|uniref:Rab-GAP TBC domain-containing protein n=1 Tax=Zizania palustris TaxID=103762 RepID=A0A8J5X3A0_ZIZPA|nr:hypothetical protein GUJ93_ZPchr0013g34091 [Zizania palustris]
MGVAFDFEYKRDAYGFAVRPQHLQRFREYAKIYKEEEDERANRWKDFLDRLAGPADDCTTSISPSKEDASVRDVCRGGRAENIENSNRSGIQCDDEEEVAEDPEKNDKSENLKEVDGDDQPPDANGEAENFNDGSGNSEKLKEEGTANSVHFNKASEELKEVNGRSEEQLNEDGSSKGLKGPDGILEGLGQVNNDSLKKLEELFLDKGLLDELKPIRVESEKRVRASISIIEKMMSSRIVKIHNTTNEMHGNGVALASIEEERTADMSCRGDQADRSSDPEKVEQAHDEEPSDSTSATLEGGNGESYFPWREELESLVRGGVPMALRGEMWQAFVGVGARKITGYYNKLLDEGTEELDEKNLEDHVLKEQTNAPKKLRQPEKWKGQIEKDLPRTFPGHPALDEDGRNALRRLLTAYARHNPSVGYCQAMNFFAGLFLLFMPEEQAFWALVGVIDEYFDGYYTEEMIESQVDQLVLEEVVRERFPKLAKHMDFLGVQVAWVTGPWFLSIFINMLPWESVLRVWDVILFEGNRTMLFRTTLALLDLYGPALVTTKDAGDAITLLQSLAGSTFDSSQLVLTVNSKEGADGLQIDGEMQFLDSGSANLENYLSSSALENELDNGMDLQDQVTWLKVELCKLLEEKRSAELRGEELETALMEMVKQDNRRMLSAKVEKLEAEVSELRKSFADKQEQEQAMLQILIRMEQEQKVAEDARIAAERDASEQKYAAHLLQEKYEATMAALSQMEKRAVMAETMLDATKHYQDGQVKANKSFNSSPPHAAHLAGKPNQDPNQDAPNRRLGLLSRGLGWLEKSKGKSSSTETSEG